MGRPQGNLAETKHPCPGMSHVYPPASTCQISFHVLQSVIETAPFTRGKKNFVKYRFRKKRKTQKKWGNSGATTRATIVFRKQIAKMSSFSTFSVGFCGRNTSQCSAKFWDSVGAIKRKMDMRRKLLKDAN